MVVWFVTIGVLGVARARCRIPQRACGAINPAHAVRTSSSANGMHGFLVLGSVFLVVTGGEALYADMGHFGKRPIRLAWFAHRAAGVDAELLRAGRAAARGTRRHAEQPFYLLAPPGCCYPLVALATIAAVIASQALISAVFSLTRQAVQLGYSPALEHPAHVGRRRWGRSTSSRSTGR